MKRIVLSFLVVAILIFLGSLPTWGKELKIGVLAKRGRVKALERWAPMVFYLNRALPEYRFQLVPLDFYSLRGAVQAGELDFILANPAMYVEFEALNGASRIATLKNSRQGGVYTVFGGVIFCRADRPDIKDLSDLRGKRFAAVNPYSFGGWHMAWRELKQRGIDPQRDFQDVLFLDTHDEVVYAVLNGAVDAGTVRTDTLETMAQEGKINLKDFRILSPRQYPGFPFLVSTRLYPEWPFAKARHTPDDLAEKVAIALMKMPPESPAALAAGIAGWTIPKNYQPVHECLKELHIGPYQDLGRFTLKEAIRKYWYLVGLLLLFALCNAVVAIYVAGLNRRLREAKAQLERARNHLEEKVRERTAHLEVLNQKLREEITERERAEAELSAEKERLAVTMASIGEAVLSTDEKGRIQMMNRAAEEITGWSRDEAWGRPVKEIFRLRSDDRTQSPDPVDQCLRERQLVEIKETVLLTRNDKERLIEGTCSPIHERKSLIVGAVMVFRDITERKKLEEEMLKSNKLESLAVLAGGIAHDFNNILTAILGNLSLAKYQIGEGDVRLLLDQAERASLRAKALAQRLLAFAKEEVASKRVVSIAELVKEATSFALRGSQIMPRFAISSDLWPVEADEDQISIVINNLVINAKEAMPEGGQLEISATNVHLGPEDGLPLPSGPYVRLSIRDEGVGIPPEVLPRIFDPFFTSKPNGSGLGLATCFSVIRRHGGHITVESEVGRGTTFHIYLPAKGGQKAPGREEEQIPPLKKTGKILVMDDEEMVRETLGEMLRHLGCEVAFAKEGGEAIELYQQAQKAGQPFDLVIMDLTIPGGMGGKEAVAKLLKIDPKAKVIVSSGYSSDPIMNDYQHYGFQGLLNKPYRITELVKILEELL
ncbi:PhnD/SsuA/transferrin family substrate-binding protein [Thermosulfuriphilus sp.]